MYRDYSVTLPSKWSYTPWKDEVQSEIRKKKESMTSHSERFECNSRLKSRKEPGTFKYKGIKTHNDHCNLKNLERLYYVYYP